MINSLYSATTREPARALVRAVAGFFIAAALSSFVWFGHIGLGLLTTFWALVLFGPVLAWPLTWGPLLGRGSLAVGAICLILPGYLGNGSGASPGETAVLIAVSIPFFVLAALLSFPQALVALVRYLVHR